ncbi:MAG TPA: DUF998 domain-containing protein [Longimicrobiales bacterium]|nr:DUF998 domain-containing protein [Longimicrobiales bacterium]
MSHSISTQANTHIVTRFTAAQVCAGAVGVFVTLVSLLHFIEPEFGPMWRFVSEYSHGANGWIMKLAFFVLAFACAAAIAAIRPYATTRAAKGGLFFLALTVVGLVLAGMFDQDPITSDVKTREGSLHAFATMLGIPGFTAAALLLGLSLARRWTSARRPLLLLSQLPWITFVSMPVYMAVAMPAAGGFGPTVWVGLINRLFLVAMCAWLMFVAWQIERTAQ